MPQNANWLQKYDGSGLTDSMVWSDSTSVAVKNNGAFPSETFENNSDSGMDGARAGIRILQSRTGESSNHVEGFLIIFPSDFEGTWGTGFLSRYALVGHTNCNGVDIVADKSTGDIRFYTGGHASTNERMRIKSDGYVGIGLTNPSVPLHVKRASGADICVLETASGSANLLFRPGGTQAGEIKATTSLLEINANNTIGGNQDMALITQGGATNGIYIKAGGNVGIGTTSPAERLHVSGNVRIAGGYLDGEEIADPGNPATDRGRLFFRDNGSGKTQTLREIPNRSRSNCLGYGGLSRGLGVLP